MEMEVEVDGMSGEERREEKEEEYVYRISSSEEWAELQKSGFTFGGDLDKSTSCFHLSTLLQVRPTLQRFYSHTLQDLYLLQIHSAKLGDGLIYELVDATQRFPHYYGPSRSFAPLPLSAVIKAHKLTLSDSTFSCPLLDLLSPSATANNPYP